MNALSRMEREAFEKGKRYGIKTSIESAVSSRIACAHLASMYNSKMQPFCFACPTRQLISSAVKSRKINRFRPQFPSLSIVAYFVFYLFNRQIKRLCNVLVPHAGQIHPVNLFCLFRRKMRLFTHKRFSILCRSGHFLPASPHDFDQCSDRQSGQIVKNRQLLFLIFLDFIKIHNLFNRVS